MEKTNKKAMIAALCYLLFFFLRLIGLVGSDMGFSTFMFCLLFMVLSGALLFENRPLASVLAGLYSLFHIYLNIQLYSEYGSFYKLVAVPNIFLCIAYAALSYLLYLAYKKNNLSAKVWFVPALLLLVSYIASYSGKIKITLGDKLIYQQIVEVASMLFTGLWVKDCIDKESATAPVNTPASVSISNGQGASLDKDPVETLKVYKELLDSGIITQEEFDQKKSQLLGI